MQQWLAAQPAAVDAADVAAADASNRNEANSNKNLAACHNVLTYGQRAEACRHFKLTSTLQYNCGAQRGRKLGVHSFAIQETVAAIAAIVWCEILKVLRHFYCSVKYWRHIYSQL